VAHNYYKTLAASCGISIVFLSLQIVYVCSRPLPLNNSDINIQPRNPEMFSASTNLEKKYDKLSLKKIKLLEDYVMNHYDYFDLYLLLPDGSLSDVAGLYKYNGEFQPYNESELSIGFPFRFAYAKAAYGFQSTLSWCVNTDGYVLSTKRYSSKYVPVQANVLPARYSAVHIIYNVILCSATLLILFHASTYVWINIILRRYRIKRGQCHACGYPVGSAIVCSECGMRTV
jgi:hypothetical protein